MATTEADADEDAPEAYRKLLDRYSRLSNLGSGMMYLGWDQQVMMPQGGAPARAQQLSALRKTTHELLSDPEVGDWLSELDEGELTPEQAACIREIRRDYERAASVPADLVEELTRVGAENQQIWQNAKANDDFESFAPRLELLRDLTRERAEYIDPDKPPYEVLYEDSHPYISLEQMEEVFATLREEIPPLVDEIRNAETELADPFDGEYSDEEQRAACEAVLDFLGYDRDRGRLDTAPHPFMTGTQFDARVTTRFDAGPLDSLMSTVHEFGHASYQLGLRQDAYATPLGSSRRSVHESQSRFWENHIGRSEPFWEVFLPTFTEHIDSHDDLTVGEVHEAINRINPDNLIRVEADELTYHMHIILRCEIDRQFVEGDLPVSEMPAVWNEKMDDYLGVSPDTDTEGCLQDIHWTRGFAVFQTYTLGSVVAAQLDAAIREDLDVDGLVREGEFDPIHEWMTDHVHRHGQRYTTPELIEVATGEPLTAEYFVDYVRDKFERLYNL